MDDIEEIRLLLRSIALLITQSVDKKRKKGIEIVYPEPHYRYIPDCDIPPSGNSSLRTEYLEIPAVDKRIETEIITFALLSEEMRQLKQKIWLIRGEGSIVPTEKFQREVLNEYVVSDNSAERISQLIETYSHDLVHEDPRVRQIAYLTGLFIKRGSIQLAPGITLRSPTMADFEETVPVRSLVFSIPSPRDCLHGIGSILEAVFDIPENGKTNERIDTIIEELRLFFRKPIQWLYIIRSPLSLYDSESRSLGRDRYAANSKAELDDDHGRDLLRFFDEFDAKFEDARNRNHIKIATEKYSEALLARSGSEKRIADAIMGLEALFFKTEGERTELDYRLQLRIAKLMSIFSFDPISVKQTVKKAYYIRSVYAHGNVLSENDLKKISKDFGGLNEILENILEYIQISLMSIVFNDLGNKNAFVQLIEDALIDENSNLELKEKIRLPDYVLNR